MKIFLVGMPGSGKSTLGRALASRLMVDFIDLDAEIEQAEQRSIADVFRQQGEAYFRTVESRLLAEWAASPRSFVMSTGGGAPCFHRGMETINHYGVSVFLDCPVQTLVERVRNKTERPLLLTTTDDELRQRLEAMRSQRLACYRQATLTVENPSVEMVIDRLALKK